MILPANMMQVPLLISSILTHAASINPDQKIIGVNQDQTLNSMSFSQFEERTKRLAVGLGANGVVQGARVGTLAWNTIQHLELYYAISGIGSVCHTINPRLHLDQIAYIINHAQDDVMFYDPDFEGIVAAVKQSCPSVRFWVPMQDGVVGDQASYEGWLHDVPSGFCWPEFDENAACGLCYTSGTTGDPKGALYSHRSTLLHAYASCHPDAVGISQKDTVMPVVPMFHVNAWGLPYSAMLSGASIALPGANLKGDALYRLCEIAGVTISAGVPTVWQGVVDHVEAGDLSFSSLKEIMIGGVACPPSMIRSFQSRGVDVRHAWGMTEVSPLGTVCRLMPDHNDLSAEDQMSILAKQGRPLFGVEFGLQSDDGSVLPHDGKTPGHLTIRGPWVVERYYGQNESAAPGGWFHTGDVASIDYHGYLSIQDRSKDVIKSGGEWISSIELENIAMEHPAVEHAACIAETNAKWGERPILVLTVRHDMAVSADEILSLFTGRIAKWSIPDRVTFIEAMPMTATGKIQKATLRNICHNSN